MMRIAIYGRVSWSRRKDNGSNEMERDAESQFRSLRSYAAAQGWEIVREYADRASGGRADREQFRAMMEAASRREFDLVLFWALDRLSREGVVETLNHLQRLSGWGVGWRSYTEQYLDSTGIFREAVIAILAAIAKQERVRLSERSLAGIERARAKGKQIGRPWAEDADPRLASRVSELRAQGLSIRRLSQELRVSTHTVLRLVHGSGDRASA